ncbi:MAG: 4-demethylwyosine synthase TYW1 [Nanoarchaeota archaeon]|nr:4-demethylwyosine synthase TYW1 [Nanoarchaeota archaeon]MBU4300125.1 4-demethylwyosine synthase TYW1 [Nanoarchaeota archaeon]MBU4451761.1 4-demethylwyosine synthase TYW1 [Nanoarchaeota archaeon]MCG2724331.1 4-demethylwyosine synthase TYW1 [archaeon]
MPQLPENIKILFRRQNYGLVGNHSAVKICEWTKKSLRNESVCYKEKFYGKLHGIRSHTCLQMTPAAYFCPNRCVYCWRATDKTSANSMDGFEVDEPKEIIEKSIEVQRVLLSGFKGFEGTNMKKWKEAQEPKNAAISLTGEPTAYPKISALIEEFKKRDMSTFLVTNGQFPEYLKNIEEPSQLYLSLDAPTKEIYKKVDIPQFADFWERFEETITLMPSFSCKKAVRLTLVKGRNDSHAKEYAELIMRADADFVEIKAYMWIGFSRMRLPIEAMPLFAEVQKFAEELNAHLGYLYKDEDARSRVILLTKK